MNKGLVIVLLILAILLGGCGSIGATTEDTNAQNATTQATTHPETTGVSSGLPQVQYLYVQNGFLKPADTEGGYVISVLNGKPETICLTEEYITVLHKGEQVVVPFSYCLEEGHLYVESTDTYSVEHIEGSDRFAQLVFGTQTDAYGYLIDVREKTVLDPLLLVDPEIVAAIDQIYFAPDGNHAMLCCEAGDVWRVLDCATGETQRLDELTGIDNCYGYFMEDGDHVRVGQYGDDSALYAYSIRTGECRQITNYTVYTSGCETKIVEGYLTIVDLASGEEIKTQFSESVLATVCWYGQKQVLVVARNILHILTADGNIKAVCELSKG